VITLSSVYCLVQFPDWGNDKLITNLIEINCLVHSVISMPRAVNYLLLLAFILGQRSVYRARGTINDCFRLTVMDSWLYEAKTTTSLKKKSKITEISNFTLFIQKKIFVVYQFYFFINKQRNQYDHFDADS
jgi:hypothetical protein